MKLNTIVIIFLSLFIFYIIYSNYTTLVEDFTPQSIVPSSSTTDAANNIYQYLAPLSSDNTWSQDTQNDWVKKFNDTLTSLDSSAALLTTPTFNNINYMTVASEEEAQSYIQNGIWPLDTYITNLYNDKITESEKLDNVSEEDKTKAKNMWEYAQKIYPNRLIYQNILGANTLPQTAVLLSLNPNVGSGMINNENRKITCKSAIKGTISQPDGTNIQIPDNGMYPVINNGYTLDYTIFESIPGLIFDTSACNICGIDNFNYLSTNNKCKFSLNNPVAYDIFTGLNKSTPSSV
jgi:hypothetical protein